MNRSIFSISIFVILLISTLGWANPNPDVPFGGVVLDLNYGVSNNTPLGKDTYLDTYSSTANNSDRYNLYGDNGRNYSAMLLVPISSRFTGRLGFHQSENNYHESRFTESNVTGTDRKNYIRTLSVGLRIHIGGSNNWNK